MTSSAVSCINEQGATAIEYALIASGIAAAIIITVNALGVSVVNMWTSGFRRARTNGASGPAFRPPIFPCVPSASASRCAAEPGLSGFCWLSCGAQPDSQTISKVARRRPSASAKRSA